MDAKSSLSELAAGRRLDTYKLKMIRILTAVSLIFHLVGSQSIYDGEDKKVAQKSKALAKSPMQQFSNKPF